MNITRNDTWRADLAAFAQASARAAFKPGKHDCALFAAGAVHAMTGVDLARGWRSKYRSLKRGEILLREKGFDDLPSLVAEYFEEVPPILAQVGDIAVVEEGGAVGLGIVQGRFVWVLRMDGLGIVELSTVSKAFRV